MKIIQFLKNIYIDEPKGEIKLVVNKKGNKILDESKIIVNQKYQWTENKSKPKGN